MPFKQFLFPAYTKQLQERFEMIKPFAQLMKWYHHVPNAATGNIMTAPCSFSKFKPVLKFEVAREKEQLKLLTISSINGSDYELGLSGVFIFCWKVRMNIFYWRTKITEHWNGCCKMIRSNMAMTLFYLEKKY